MRLPFRDTVTGTITFGISVFVSIASLEGNKGGQEAGGVGISSEIFAFKNLDYHVNLVVLVVISSLNLFL